VQEAEVVLRRKPAACKVTANIEYTVIELETLMGNVTEHLARILQGRLLREPFVNHQQIVRHASRVVGVALRKTSKRSQTVGVTGQIDHCDGWTFRHYPRLDCYDRVPVKKAS